MKTLLLLLALFEYTGLQDQDQLLFQPDKYTTEMRIVQTSAGNKKVIYHSFLHIPYVAKPVDKDYQSLNVFVPVEINGKMIDTKNAPILFEIGVGGYMSVRNSGGNSKDPGSFSRRADLALAAGYVVISPGCRGRDNKSADGTYYGKAPAAIVDLKAAVRYIHHNNGLIPGNTNRIFSVGCSAEEHYPLFSELQETAIYSISTLMKSGQPMLRIISLAAPVTAPLLTWSTLMQLMNGCTVPSLQERDLWISNFLKS